MRIRLITTGYLERSAIVDSLCRFFPSETEGGSVDFIQPMKTHGMTTNPVRATGSPPSTFSKMARALAAEALEGSEPDGRGTDLVVAVDDLELANLARPEIVVSCLRTAVEKELSKRARALGSSREDLMRETIRKRCSFHLFSPMVEAYFFGGDRRALTRAGVAEDKSPRLEKRDVEQFETADEEYSRFVADYNERQRTLGNDWWRGERHPKRYLEYLVSLSGSSYRETEQGSAALAGLDWPRVPPCEKSVRFLRSFFQDLADFFEVPNPLGRGETSALTYPDRSRNRDELLLRNM
ncbi:MAG: hypothetical protein R6V85_01945 [Polyangia bacterium]